MCTQTGGAAACSKGCQSAGQDILFILHFSEYYSHLSCQLSKYLYLILVTDFISGVKNKFARSTLTYFGHVLPVI